MEFYPVLDCEINIEDEIAMMFRDSRNVTYGHDNNDVVMEISEMSEGVESARKQDVVEFQTEEDAIRSNLEPVSLHDRRVDSESDRRNSERLRIRRIRERQRKERDERGPRVDEMSRELDGEHYLGSLGDKKCGRCRAFLFEAEIPRKGLQKVVVCCQQGKVKFDCFDDYPAQMKVFMNGSDPRSKVFFKQIRVFNNALAMASVSAKMPITAGRGPPTLAVHGAMNRQVGVVTPLEGKSPSFAQYYVMDPDEATQKRLECYDCDERLMQYFSSLMMRKNVLAQSYRMMGNVMKEEREQAENDGVSIPEIRMTFVTSRELDLRRYNEPTTNEVAIVYVVSDETEAPPPRYLTIYDKNKQLRTISELNSLCDPLTYPHLFPTGRKGWEPEMRANQYSSSNLCLTQREYYAFLLFTRSTFNALHTSRRLFQQYIIDAYLKIESSRLRFYRNNQEQFKLESVAGLAEFLEAGVGTDDVEQRIILPSSFVGSPRSMRTSYQDAMAIVGKYGKPDLFITFTANPQWREIQENLLPGQIAADRPDITARVFQHKMNSLLGDLTKNSLFGAVAAYVAVVEWQKRGLPHCHILLILQSRDKIRTAYQVDKFIKAELPDIEANPDLHNKVAKHMMHRVCFSLNGESATCYVSVNGLKKCGKAFPKPFCENTQLNENSYPCYKRRDDGKFICHNNFKIDNRYVVPYSPYLLRKYNSHINVEVCGMVKAVKYLFKYVYKGHDRARLRLENRQDEISNYVDGRYICAPEAVHRILGYSIERRSHSVLSLHVHEDHKKMVRFQAGQEQEALDRAFETHSTLEAWFELNTNVNNVVYDVDLSTLLYGDVPKFFRFVSGKWQPRKSLKIPVLGRIQFVSPQQSERFALRILLLNRPFMKSFSDLKTVNNIILPTFSDAAKALGFFQNDLGYNETLAEAANYHMPFELRNLFSMLIGFNEVLEVKYLWETFKMDMAEDFIYDGLTVDMALAKLYYAIEDKLLTYGKKFETYVVKPDISEETVRDVNNNFFYVSEGNRLVKTLNEQQKRVFDVITDAEGKNKLFFLDGPGGSGKTYLYNTLYNYLMGKNKKIVCVAWTGIAALLLPDGRTCHSTFKLPLDFGSVFLGINRGSSEAKKLKDVDYIIWDEFSMVPGKALYYVNNLLKYVMCSDELFGGKVMICGGDFRQILPVEEVGMPIVASTVKGSGLWSSFIKLGLRENMRVTDNNEWISFLLDVGVGKHMNSTIGKIALPSEMFTNDIIKSVIGERIKLKDIENYSSRVVLAPKNISVNHLNEDILNILEGEDRVYQSIDEVLSTDNFTEHINVEFLYSLNPSGFPPAKLRLKVGAVVILLRNLDVGNGLANGTRLMVLKMDNHVLTAKILTGSRVGANVLIPKISLICDRGFSIKFKRHQFPVKLSFAMSINKSQGQTFSHVGIYLVDPVFSHGQLYVALSRCSTRKKYFCTFA